MSDRENSSSECNSETTGPGSGDGVVDSAMPAIVSRLFLYALKDVLAARYGPAEAVDVIREGGRLAGRRFAKNVLDLTGAGLFLNHTQNTLMKMKLGALRMEKVEGAA